MADLGEPATLLGREIMAREVTIDQARAAMQGAGMPECYAQWHGELFRVLRRRPRAAAVTPDANNVTGQQPRGYRLRGRPLDNEQTPSFR